MEFFELLDRRFSARAYLKKTITEPEIRRIVQAAASAPSAGNVQSYVISIVRDDAHKEKLARVSIDQDFIAHAPLLLVFFADPARAAERYGERGAQLYCVQDTTIACAYAQLAATAMGLGTCWVGAFDETAVTKILNVPAGWRPLAILTIGHTVEKAKPRERRPLSDILIEEQELR